MRAVPRHAAGTEHGRLGQRDSKVWAGPGQRPKKKSWIPSRKLCSVFRHNSRSRRGQPPTFSIHPTPPHPVPDLHPPPTHSFHSPHSPRNRQRHERHLLSDVCYTLSLARCKVPLLDKRRRGRNIINTAEACPGMKETDRSAAPVRSQQTDLRTAALLTGWLCHLCLSADIQAVLSA